MHTPGPWHVEQSTRTDQLIFAGNRWIATAINHDFLPTAEENERTRANAHLMAKAPDLKDALQNLLTAIHHRENNPGFASAGNYVRALERARSLLED